ncbi:MAG: NF038122 family metalloprotease, partial [Cyanobacteria bacterium J06632_3]
ALASLSVLGGASAAQAVTFNFSYGENTPEEVISATTLAGDLWSSHLSDDVALNIHIDFGSLSEGLLGGARPNMVQVKYEDALEAMFLDTSSSDDYLAFEHLQVDQKSRDSIQRYRDGDLDIAKVDFSAENAFSLLMNTLVSDKKSRGLASSSLDTYLDDNGNENNKHIWMTSANAKALGLVDSHSRALDATIRFSDSVLWDFDRRDGVADNALDFLTVAQHEIGHVLGVVSGADVAGALESNSDKALKEKDLRYVSTMDLFRFSEDSANINWLTDDDEPVTGVTDWTVGRVDEFGNPIDYYFSLDGGQTKLASFARGTFGQGADGFQTSHWTANGEAPVGIMHPSLALGQSLEISDLDTQLLDVLGWNLTTVAGQTSHVNEVARLTASGLIEEFWSLALDETALRQWLDETDNQLSAYVSEEQLKIEVAEQRLEQEKDNLIDALETLTTLHKELKDAGDKNGKKQAELEIKEIEDTLKQLEKDEKEIKDLKKDLLKWGEKLQKELENQLKKFEKASDKQIRDKTEKIQEAQDKALQRLAEQEGLDRPLTFGRWSSTAHSYRLWQSLAPSSSQDDLPTGVVFQMKTADNDVVSTPEPTATFGLIVLTLIGAKRLRSRPNH